MNEGQNRNIDKSLQNNIVETTLVLTILILIELCIAN